MLDLGRADPECQGTKRAVGGGVGIAADDGGARLRQSQLRADDVDDTLLNVTQGVQSHPELLSILTQRVNL